MDYPSTSPAHQERARNLDDGLGQFSAQAHAAMCRIAMAAAEFDEIGGWCDAGIRSFAHWLTINAGFNPRTGAELLRVGKALQALPRIAAAFAAGQLSYDKVREVTTVATSNTDELMLEIARGASGSQLERICRSLRRMLAADIDSRPLAKRGLWSHMEENGMMRLVARLPAEDGAVVMAAIESITRSKPLPDDSQDAAPDPAEDRWAAKRADAVVAMAEHVLAGAATDLVTAGEARQVVVHVDVGVLTGESPDAMCELENGTPLSAAAARRLGCDAEVIPVLQRDGTPLYVGRKHRTAPPRLRRALEARDRFCTYPGCVVPARQTFAHHHKHWVDGGETSLDNMMLLCGFHHRGYHNGAFRIVRAKGSFLFEANDGHVIGTTRDVLPDQPAWFPPDSARAEWGGAPMDFDHTIFVLEQSFPPLGPRAGPAG